jgi:hypothetical protein
MHGFSSKLSELLFCPVRITVLFWIEVKNKDKDVSWSILSYCNLRKIALVIMNVIAAARDFQRLIGRTVS